MTLLARRFSRRTRAAVLGTATLAIAGYALAVGPAQDQVREASPVTVGALGDLLEWDFSYGPLAIGLLVLLCLVPMVATLADGWGEQKEKAEAARPDPEPRTPRDEEVERSLRTMRERHRNRAERERQE
ncbi:hypothetical protein [Streptomyces profundus]|uniref:hypothetical protein n=1 Tax=Streptomyces profundus TaxID=2867410 RepID=UPI001D167B47|nr:hypothetical protein [Streptomyces sp. MA3_2.13]UED84043.1 hypothetical protein K4G22_07320 [Streptomyces sp. MA3_2.13]